MKARTAALLLSGVIALSNAQADDTHMTLESEVLTNGWFQYRLSGSWNAFFTNFYGIGFGEISNIDGVGLTDGATVALTNANVSWQWPGAAPRQYEHLVTAHSAEAFVTTNTVFVFFLADMSGWGQSSVLAGNIGGYALLPVLVPSSTFDPTVTTSSISSTVVIVPDPKIVGITPQTLSIEWVTNSTIRIDATHDLVTWTNVATIFQYAPVTTWTSPVPLETYGDRFRAVLLANFPDTNLLARGASDIAPVVKIAPSSPGHVAVTFAGTPGATYAVSLTTVDGAILDSTTIKAAHSLTTVELKDAGASAPVLVRAVRQ